MFYESEFEILESEGADLESTGTSKPSDGIIDGWKPLSIGPHELDVQDPEGRTSQITNGGTITDIEALERTMKLLGQAKTEEVQRFLVRCLAGLFLLWTVIALIAFISAGNSWLLISDVGPASLLGVIVHYYFKRDK